MSSISGGGPGRVTWQMIDADTGLPIGEPHTYQAASVTVHTTDPELGGDEPVGTRGRIVSYDLAPGGYVAAALLWPAAGGDIDWPDDGPPVLTLSPEALEHLTADRAEHRRWWGNTPVIEPQPLPPPDIAE